MSNINQIISGFEKKKFDEKNNSKNLGVVYTPLQIVEYMVSNVFKLYFTDKNDFNVDTKSNISKIKILDPACGSGRFLISIAEYLFNLYKKLDSGCNDYEIKEQIVKNNLYGVDVEKEACQISKLRLLNWLKPHNIHKNENLELILKKSNIKFNILNKDFLLDYELEGFNIIIGNPPYVENKKISNRDFKTKLAEKFLSAYKLYDLSVVFIEKSINLLDNFGILSFLTPNKFLAADYGEKIRQLILEKMIIKEILNISDLQVFQDKSTYPIIIFLKKTVKDNNLILIKKFETIKQIENRVHKNIVQFPQRFLNNFPLKVIPLSENVNLINFFYSKFKTFSETYKDLKIIYRPFGFIKWAENSKYIKPKQTSPHDLLLLGTGNIGRYYFDFNKHLKVASNRYQNPYYEYNEDFKEIWKELSNEKLIFREIAKDLTFVYDPGIFANLTGLYFIKIPSLSTSELFGLLAILNSNIANMIFKSLYGTLHMAGGYLRFNGSFIKKIPIPNPIPMNLSRISKMIHFLTQYKYEVLNDRIFNPKIEIDLVKEIIDYLHYLIESVVSTLYELTQSDLNFKEIDIPEINFKFIYSYYTHNQFITYTNEELILNYNIIKNWYLNSQKIENLI